MCFGRYSKKSYFVLFGKREKKCNYYKKVDCDRPHRPGSRHLPADRAAVHTQFSDDYFTHILLAPSHYLFTVG